MILDRFVAIKLILPNHVEWESGIKRFQAEAALLRVSIIRASSRCTTSANGTGNTTCAWPSSTGGVWLSDLAGSDAPCQGGQNDP